MKKEQKYEFVCNECGYKFYTPKGGRCPNCCWGNYKKVVIK